VLTEIFVQRVHRRHSARFRSERLSPPPVTFGGVP
jgi:hypothetical protein